MAYHPNTLRDICRLRKGLAFYRQEARGNELTADSGEEAAVRLLRVVLLGRLHGPLRRTRPSYLSNQMPRTYAPKPGYAVRFWRSRGLRPPEVNTLELLARTAPRLLCNLPGPVAGSVVCGDARQVDFRTLGGPYSWVITSPPYWGMRTYVPDQWLRLWFLGGPAQVTYAYYGQIGGASAEIFVSGLRQVWERVATACRAGARLVVRFGALPSVGGADAVDLVRASLGGTPWRIKGIRDAGNSDRGRRQVRGFLKTSPPAVQEVDVEARFGVTSVLAHVQTWCNWGIIASTV